VKENVVCMRSEVKRKLIRETVVLALLRRGIFETDRSDVLR
jgi:hypothetical protein